MTTYAVPFSGAEIQAPNAQAGMQTIGNIVNTVSGLQGIAQAAQVNPQLAQQAAMKTQSDQMILASQQQENAERLAMNKLLAEPGATNPDGTLNMGYSPASLYDGHTPAKSPQDLVRDANGNVVLDASGNPVNPPAGTVAAGAQTYAQRTMQMAPQTGAQRLGAYAKTNSDTIAANKSAFDLDQSTLAGFNDVVGSLRGQSSTDVMNGLTNYVDSLDPASQKRMQPMMDQVQHVITQTNQQNSAQESPVVAQQRIDAVLGHLALRTQTISDQKNITSPAYGVTSAGGTAKVSQTNPWAPGGTVAPNAPATPQNPVIPMTLTPGERAGFVTNPLTGAPYPYQKDAYGNIVGAGTAIPTAGGGTIPPAAGGGTTPAGGTVSRTGAQVPWLAIPPSETVKTGADFQAERQAANNAAQQANTLASNNQQVLQLLKQGTTTGPGAQAAQNVLGSLAAQKIAGVTGWKPTEADNLSSITHYLAQNLGAQAKTMGVPNTNEGQEAAQAVAGGTGMTTVALSRAVKANDALTSGVKDFNTGNEAAITARAASGQPGDPIFAMRQFKNAWANNFNPDIYKLQNAIRDKDTPEQNRILAEYGKPAPGQTPSPQWNNFVGQIKNLRSLTTTGALPPPGQ